MATVTEKYTPIIEQMMANSLKQHTINEDNVWQEGNKTNLHLFYKIVDDLMLPGSAVMHINNLIDLYRLAQDGKSCLILMEHYSNFDLPCLYRLVEKGHHLGPQVADSIVAIAGMKLNEESPTVLAFAEAFSRIIIYPSRSLQNIKDPAVLEAETKKSKIINLAAMKALGRAKSSGKLILVFPAGTRYRIGRPETKKGVKEIDSYLKGFDYMVLVGLNGCNLVAADGPMHEEVATEDIIHYTVSPVISCAEFRSNVTSTLPEGTEDPKQYTVDRIMTILDEIHEEAEEKRVKLLQKNH